MIGTGNKFEEETDISGSGELPLEFHRFYNSHMRKGNEDSYFGESTYASLFPDIMVAAFVGGGNGDYQTIDLEIMGTNWRHTYQRAVLFRNSSALSSVLLYREDGKVIPMTYNGTSYVGPADLTYVLAVAAYSVPLPIVPLGGSVPVPLEVTYAGPAPFLVAGASQVTANTLPPGFKTRKTSSITASG